MDEIVGPEERPIVIDQVPLDHSVDQWVDHSMHNSRQ